MSSTPTDFFTKELAEKYDERNSSLSAISENLHFLIRLVLEKLPSRAHILSAGAGTGAEILSLAKAFPEWSFVAVEPSRSMLDVCKKRVKEAGFSDRCEFVHGFAKDLPQDESFDAALAVLVGHFIKKNERVSFYNDLTSRLKPGGYFVNAEISYDLESPQFLLMLDNWKSIQKRMGATPESLDALSTQLKETLTVLPPSVVAQLISDARVATPVLFFQAFMIAGWYGVKR